MAVALADRSDDVARVLDAGDGCRALTIAEQLRSETIAAINTGRVPSVFQEPLLDRVNSLATRIRCMPPAAEPGLLGTSGGGGDKESKQPTVAGIAPTARAATPAAEARNLSVWLRRKSS